ncbi:uncharacterized protein LOC132743245 [Ruditapes philippinarum]|uniref:uncharacterized protein LOC132743245 n=1 Tax=Ruditapes philippinarum TaxID=129788 RepID=UPI00295C189F|nr:uncharacterized protein LOC132743245 [Ruditapes philippinarum]
MTLRDNASYRELYLKSCKSHIERLVEMNARAVLLFSCYLPTENSTRGRDSQGFFSHLLAQIYVNSESDTIIVAADFNSRIGSLSDILSELDCIPQRTVLDKTINQHGHAFIEFLNDARFCVLNGRFNINDDNYTSVSRKGRAVVDYLCVPQDNLHLFEGFKVITVQSIVDAHGLHGLLGERSRLPDHNILITEFNTLSSENVGQSCDNHERINCPRYNLQRIPVDFMSSDLSRLALLDIISSIESSRETQTQVNIIYEKLCSCIRTEMNNSVPKFSDSKPVRKRYKNKKPLWNDRLTELWSDLSANEKLYSKCNGTRTVRIASRREYIAVRNTFDKELRTAERQYRAAIALDIEDTSTNNPKDFWNKINKLGPRKCKDIPIEIIDSNGRVCHDESSVFERWRSDFENLYHTSDNTDFDEDFFDRNKVHKQLLELNMLDPLYSENEQLNSNITIDEITNIVMTAKSRSTCGYDQIPYDVLKFPDIIVVLQQLFQLIMDTSIIPTLWRKSIICPVLKDPTSDARLPMNYRGISLLSCVSKLYSSFINKKLIKYLDDNDILAEEQNGFRHGRSCEDHVFTLDSIIRDHNSVFTAFIDLRKCFDFVDREMQMYKLLLNGVDGKLYNSIKSIYNHTVSCVRINGRLTEWFQCVNGVKQGDNLSPTLFSVFVNDLVTEINNLDLGVKIDDTSVSMLLYADDIVLIAKSEADLQIMLNQMHDWCKRWRVLVNTEKSKVVHFRKGRTQRTEYEFKIGLNVLEIVDKYKYLGVIMHEKRDYSFHCEILSKSAGRAL